MSIPVVVAEDSYLAREAITRVLTDTPDTELVGSPQARRR